MDDNLIATGTTRVSIAGIDDAEWVTDWPAGEGVYEYDPRPINFEPVDFPATAEGEGTIPVGTACEYREDGVATWRGEVTKCADDKWLAVLYRVEP